MDTRTRIERNLDKLRAQQRKNWEIEAKLKVPPKLTMEWTPDEQTEVEMKFSPNESEVQKPKTKKTTKSKAKAEPKPKSSVQMSRGKETQSLLQRNCEFQVIGSGRPSLKADSAGHKLDTCYKIRTQQRLKFVNALMTGDIPPGSMNAMSIAIRIESVIFRVLSQHPKEYHEYCDHCSGYIAEDNHRYIRHRLMLGQLDPDEFAFVPSNRSNFQDVIEMRIKWKKVEEKEKLKQLKKGIV